MSAYHTRKRLSIGLAIIAILIMLNAPLADAAGPGGVVVVPISATWVDITVYPEADHECSEIVGKARYVGPAGSGWTTEVPWTACTYRIHRRVGQYRNILVRLHADFYFDVETSQPVSFLVSVGSRSVQ